jgi:threonine dehydratase
MTVTPTQIAEAHDRIRAHVRRTPVLDVATNTFGVAHPLALKLELFQHAGSFKPRGAFNNLLSRKVPAAGVAAASGGNHGIAVAYAAKQLGVPAHIFVPTLSSKVKIARIRSLGAEVRDEGDLYPDALALANAYVAESGALSVHAYNSAETIAGQGSVGREWEEQSPGLDTILVAVGGGGLIAGIAAWFAGRVKIVAVEPETSDCLHAARQAGKPVDVPVGGIAADSLGARIVGERAFAITQQYVAESVVVPDAAIAEAQARLWREARIAAEPGGATALAALIAGAYAPQPNERVGVLVCGGNVDLVTLSALANRA